MRFYTDYALTKTVRSSEKFVTPKNIILKILIFLGVFYIGQIAESIPLVLAVMPKLTAWATEQIKTTGSLDETALQEKLTNLLADPANTKIMLYCTIFATLLTLVFCRFIEGRKLSTLGFRKKHAILHYISGLGVGFLLFSLVVLLSLCMGGITWNGLQTFSISSILIMLGGWLLQGMSEEVICRGYFMTTILRNYSPVWAVAVNSIFFGFMHKANSGFSLVAFVNLTLYAIMISLYVLRTDSLLGACAIHSVWNFVQGNFYGLPVSGIDTGGTIFSVSLVKNADFANGGKFGLEASLPCAIVMLIAIAVLLLVPMKFLENQEKQA
ncbi:MAG: CPBP family intramembrane metalloprotease [Oscillospiraceae bacterium]|nr:CPBP family intramembrane metalloprotease [Oscillospiraceae bacterium]